MGLTFEWDEEKAKANLRKHKVGFEEGKTVFNDPFLLTFPDPEHSESEEHYINIGTSANGRVLVIIHTERGENSRLISCRKATANERRIYEQGDF